MKEEKVGGKRKIVKFGYGCVMSMLLTHKRNRSFSHLYELSTSNRKDN